MPNRPAFSRRNLLAAGVGGASALWARAVASALPAAPAETPGGCLAFVSAATTADGGHWAFGLDAAGRELFRARLPSRGHQMAVSPDGATLFATPRRPGTTAAVVDLRQGTVAATCESSPGRHFYGHAIFSSDGDFLLTTENDYGLGRGVVAVRDARTLEVVAEFDSGGIGPHELVWLGGGRLAVANGGILTHPSAPRKKLNLGRMAPNVSILEADTGRLIDQAPALDSPASLRHLAVAGDADCDAVVVAMQYEGPPSDDVPLLAAYRGNGALEPWHAPLDRQRNMKQYVASVAVDQTTGHAAATCPRANLVTFWDVPTRRYLGESRLRDCGGVAVSAEGEFVVTSGVGAVVRFDAGTFARRERGTTRFAGIRWDNHLTAVRA